VNLKTNSRSWRAEEREYKGGEKLRVELRGKRGRRNGNDKLR
jgi:hypothetical protein